MVGEAGASPWPRGALQPGPTGAGEAGTGAVPGTAGTGAALSYYPGAVRRAGEVEHTQSRSEQPRTSGGQPAEPLDFMSFILCIMSFSTFPCLPSGKKK